MVLSRSGASDLSNYVTWYDAETNVYSGGNSAVYLTSWIQQTTFDRRFTIYDTSTTARITQNTGTFGDNPIYGDSANNKYAGQSFTGLTTLAPLLSKLSVTPDATFTDVTNGANTHPFPSGEQVKYVVQPSTTLVDSYSTGGNSYNTTNYSGFGQAFTAIAGSLLSCKFSLRKTLNPTGNAVAKIYNYTGSPGTTAKPTGAALATSDNVDVAGIGGSQADVTFTFSGANKITLVAGTVYIITFEFSGVDASNNIIVYLDASGTDDGNSSYYDGASWSYVSSAYDLRFAVYVGDPPLTANTLYYWRVAGKDPSGSNNYGVWSTTWSFTITGGSTGIKVWNGTTWGYKPVKVWNGSAWVAKPVKVWNGSAWVVKG